MSAVVHRYVAALSAPGGLRLVLSSLVGRAPIGVLGLAMLLLLRHQGYSYGTAGMLAATEGVGQALAGPVLGRVIDRYGQRRVLMPLGCAFPALVGTTGVLVVLGAPSAVLAAGCLLSGAAIPPVGPSLRAIWPPLLDKDIRASALTLDATLQELVFLAGPMIATVVSISLSPLVAVLGAAFTGSVGCLWFATAPAAGRRGAQLSGRGGFHAGPLRVGGVAVAVSVAVFLGASWGALQIGVTAFTESRGSLADAGFALSAFGVGSLIGAAVAGALAPPAQWRLRLVWLSILTAALVAGCAAAPSAHALVALMFVAGLPNAALLATIYVLIGEFAPSDQQTEAFTWTTSALFLGGSVGTSVTGHVSAAADPRWGLLAAAIVTAGCAVAALAGWRALATHGVPQEHRRGGGHRHDQKNTDKESDQCQPLTGNLPAELPVSGPSCCDNPAASHRSKNST